MNTIKLKSRIEEKRQTAFYDFLIDGQSLFDICKMKGSDRIGSLGRGIDLDYNKSLIRQFYCKKEMKNWKVIE